MPAKLAIPEVGESICSRCDKVGPSTTYVAVRHLYGTIQNPTRTLRSITVEHLCPKCLAKDAMYNEHNYETPAKKATRIRQRAKDRLS